MITFESTAHRIHLDRLPMRLWKSRLCPSEQRPRWTKRNRRARRLVSSPDDRNHPWPPLFTNGRCHLREGHRAAVVHLVVSDIPDTQYRDPRLHAFP